MRRTIQKLFCFSRASKVPGTDQSPEVPPRSVTIKSIPSTPVITVPLPTSQFAAHDQTQAGCNSPPPAIPSIRARANITCASSLDSSFAESALASTTGACDNSSVTSGTNSRLEDNSSLPDGFRSVCGLQLDRRPTPPPISFNGYGSFGGRFAPESIIGFLDELTRAFESAISDPSFWKEFASFDRTQNSSLQLAVGRGAQIWLKREDLNEYGSHKTRNIIGQLLLARRMGRAEVVTDCASAKHGTFTAAMCARLNLRCVVVMGADDAQSQSEDVLEMKMLGAKILTARTPSGMGTLRAAITEALRYSVCNHETAYYLMGGPVGPNPIPTLTRTFQQRMGEEVAIQMHQETGRQPDALIAAVGSGAGAVGLFRPFLHNPAIRLIGVESAGAATLTEGSMGVLQGARTLMLQNDDGQILDCHSISPDMNLSTVGPELAYWKESGRVRIRTATDAEALDGFKTLQHHEGILSGLDSSHAVLKAIDLAKELGPGKNLVLLVTGCDSIDMRAAME
ncbi:Tryptophan synthase [Penicillium diatomitis]|uniref:tryptophan synthase n=1 Tax=Penicillium diatomitis TaxID=2819901 RepID=A0A9X0BTE6_9EURO|nr:Tryptophan synthase [Penicillium diatomitis]KAJ5483024.1 Tryptophan synthase [Penicillium diatomitis]